MSLQFWSLAGRLGFASRHAARGATRIVSAQSDSEPHSPFEIVHAAKNAVAVRPKAVSLNRVLKSGGLEGK
jgi:hypothetical protein